MQQIFVFKKRLNMSIFLFILRGELLRLFSNLKKLLDMLLTFKWTIDRYRGFFFDFQQSINAWAHIFDFFFEYTILVEENLYFCFKASNHLPLFILSLRA